jgi:UDP-2-acetamido-3-amino-2,3-dideoxy-glucuronate N-acetyltransferase
MSYISDKSNVYESAILGKNIKVGAFAEIGKDVVIGDNVNISCGVFIPENTVIEANVFIGPHTVFTNDKNPPSNGAWRNNKPTIVKSGASIGANCTILPSLLIGENSRIGAGSVVTKDVMPNTLVYGNPAKEVK